MVAPEDLAAALADPYRVACPRGHTALDPAETTASAYCRTCQRAYPVGELVDKRCGGERAGRNDPRAATPASTAPRETVKCECV